VLISDVGWVISSVPALDELIARGAGIGPPIPIVHSVPQPDYAVAAVALNLAAEEIHVAAACPPGRACLPIDPEQTLAANSVVERLNAPVNSIIGDFGFKGVQRNGSVSLDLEQSKTAGEVRASVTASPEATVAGEVTVAYEPIALRIVHRVDLTKDDHPGLFRSHSRRYELTFKASPGYRFVDVRLETESATKAGVPDVKISENKSELTFSVELRSGSRFDRFRGWFHGALVTRQERIL
jgi:hypothetical protein